MPAALCIQFEFRTLLGDSDDKKSFMASSRVSSRVSPRAGAMFVPLLFVLFLLSSTLSADVLILQDGQKLHGRFLGVDEDGYNIELEDGEVKSFPEEDIADVQIDEEAEEPSPPPPTTAKAKAEDPQSPDLSGRFGPFLFTRLSFVRPRPAAV